MFRVKNMTTEEITFAVRVTDTMDWKLVQEDFEFMMKLEPKGCFVMFDDSERIGIVTTISFGKVGWLGNLIVAESLRKKGAGSLLARHAINYLKNKNVETVGLYAYIDKIPFYKRLGFEYDSDFIVAMGKGFHSPHATNVREAEREDIPKIIKFDETCFGASRKKLLEPILQNDDNLCYLFVENGRLLGYAVTKIYEDMAELGPMVCRRAHNEVTVNLLKASLDRLEGLEVSVCVPKRESEVLNLLMKSGFTENFRVARMFLKPRPVEDCIYVAESLERG